MIHKFFEKAKYEKGVNVRVKKPLIAAVTFLVISSAAALIIQESSDAISIKESNEVRDIKSIRIEKTIDITREREKLQQEGYSINKEDINLRDIGDSNPIEANIAYIMTLKDKVFNADYVIKGQVLGVRYFISKGQVYTKAKILVEESYDNNFKLGEIITVNKFVGIIKDYQFIILHGIDNTFNIPKEELEEAKKKMAVINTDGKLPYPEDNVILLINKNSATSTESIQGEYSVSNTVVKYKDNKFIESEGGNDKSTFYSYFSANEKKFYYYDKVSDLEEKLKSDIEEKKNFSKEKAIQAAYNSIGEEDKKRISDIDKTKVIYHTTMEIVGENKVDEEKIDVIIPTNDGESAIFVRMKKDYEIIKIGK